MIRETTLPIAFGQGVDTKTDPKAIPTGKLLKLQDAIFTNPKRILKRNGYSVITSNLFGGGSNTSWNMLKSYNSEIVGQSSTSLFSYTTNASVWKKVGNYESVDLTRQTVFDGITGTSGQTTLFSGVVSDAAYLGGYALSAISTGTATSQGNPIVVTIRDTTTGTVVYYDETSFTGVNPRVVALGSTAFAMIFSSSQTLTLRTFTVSGGSGVTVGSAVTIDTLYYDYAHSAQAGGSLDVLSTSLGATLSYAQDNAGTFSVVVKTVNTSGTVTNTATTSISTVTNNRLMTSITIDPTNGNVWLYYWDGANLVYKVYNSSLSSTVAGPITIVNFGSPNGISIFNFSATPVDTTHQTLYVSYLTDVNGQSTTYSYSLSTSSAGSAVFQVFLWMLCSKPFLYNGNYYILYMYYPTGTVPIFSTYAVINLSNTNTVARFFSESVPIKYGSLAVLAQYQGYLFSSNLISSSQALLGPTAYDPNNLTLISPLTISSLCYLNFTSTRAYRAFTTSEVLALNGACPTIYDGKNSSEMGFNVRPEIEAATGSNAGGNLGTGTYGVMAVYQWVDNQGNIHFSGTSNPVNVNFMSGSTNQIQVTVTNCVLTQKGFDVQIALYRTTANGTIFYLDQAVSNSSYKVFQNVTMNSTQSDTAIQVNTTVYTNGGVLVNSSPPPSMLLATHNNRLWMVDSTNTNTVWYSKTFSPGTGLSLSGFLIQNIDTNGGDITAINEMDDKMVCFKGQNIYWFTGDGATPTGLGSTLSQPFVLPTDAGCDQPNSVILMPMGIIRHTPKGFYLLSRSLQDAYFGWDVEAYNTQNYTAATLINDKNQVRFLTNTNSGLSLIYDYVMNQWGTFTNHLGVSADLFQGLYIYARTDGNLYQENTTSFLDNTSSYTPIIQTGWLTSGGLQNFYRIRRMILLGDYANGSSASHGITLKVSYNYNPTTFNLDQGTFSFGSSSSSGPFQLRAMLPQQKCEAISFTFQERTDSGVSGEMFDLTELAVEAAVKYGVDKLPASQTTG